MGRLKIGGARLLFTLHPPPSGMGGDPGVGGSELASGEGTSDGTRSKKRGQAQRPGPSQCLVGGFPSFHDAPGERLTGEPFNAVHTQEEVEIFQPPSARVEAFEEYAVGGQVAIAQIILDVYHGLPSRFGMFDVVMYSGLHVLAPHVRDFGVVGSAQSGDFAECLDVGGSAEVDLPHPFDANPDDVHISHLA